MLDHGSPAAESAPANNSPAPLVSAAPAEILPAPLDIELRANSISLVRQHLAEQTWTFALISSMTFHLGVLVSMVLGTVLWNLLGMGSFLPPGAVAGGRAAGSNPAGIIGVAPGRIDDSEGDAEQTGGVVTISAPEQLGNLAENGQEVAGDILEAQKYALTQTQTQAVELPIAEPISPPEMAVAEAQPVTANRAAPPPPPPEVVPSEPITTVSKRLPTATLAPAFSALAIVASTSDTVAQEEPAPQLAVAKPATPATPPAPSTPAVEPTKQATFASSPVVEKAAPADKITDAPMSDHESSGVARRRGTRVVAKSDTNVELDFMGEGGGAGGPGGSGGTGGRGGTVDQGPGGTGTGPTHGGNGDLRSLVISAPEPIYPRELVAARITGRVSVRVEIDAEGKVVAVRLHQASGHDAFDQSALEAIGRWKFARLADKPWRGNVYIVPVRFRIYQ